MRVGVHKVLMNSPSDVSGLDRLIEAGTVDPNELVASIGKTEGNGGANDFTRGLATLSFCLSLARRLGISPDEVAKRIAFVWSGGTEGVLSPHATLFTRSEASPAKDKRLAIGIAVTRDLAPEEVGTMVEVREVAAAVRKAQAEAGIVSAKTDAQRRIYRVEPERFREIDGWLDTFTAVWAERLDRLDDRRRLRLDTRRR